MNRIHRYTLFCFWFTALFVLGSIAGMNYIFQRKESQLLRERGTAETESPVIAWQDAGDGAAEVTDAETSGRMDKAERNLTIKQIEDVVEYRAGASEEIFHDPVAGQITMEDAITFGEDWLVKMGFARKTEKKGNEEGGEGKSSGKYETILVSGENNLEILLRRASLGIPKNPGVSEIPMEPYYSFWTVQFLNQYMHAVLSVNAVTGKVWDAEITLYGSMQRLFSCEKLNLFMELTGISEEGENYVQVNDTGTEGILRIKNSPLYVRTKCYDTIVAIADAGDGSSVERIGEYPDLGENGCVIAEYGGGERLQEQRVIIYRLRSVH